MSEKPVNKPRKMRPGKNGGMILAEPGPGRPKGSVSLTKGLAKMLRENPELQSELLQSAIKNAMEGNAAILKLIFDRIDGPVMAEALEAGGVQVVFVNRESDADD